MILKKFFMAVLLLNIGMVLTGLCFLNKGKDTMLTDELRQQSHNRNSDKPAQTGMNEDYEPIPLPRMIGMAELIIIGSVNELADSTFVFRIEEVLKGENSGELLLVKPYIPNKFDGPRTQPYALGQRYVLFLLRYEGAPTIWHIMGYGGEGEMPVEGEFVYFAGQYIEGLERKSYVVEGLNRPLQQYDLNIFKDAVMDYDLCFSWNLVHEIKNNKPRERWVPSNNCNENLTNEFSRRSWIHQYLVQETIKYIPKNSNE
jgi:hypothetical protein